MHGNQGWKDGSLALFLVGLLLASGLQAAAPGLRGDQRPLRVTVITDAATGVAARHGLRKLVAAFGMAGIACKTNAVPDAAAGDIVVVAGLSGGTGPVAKLQAKLGLPLLTGPEALRIRRASEKVRGPLLVTGSDDRGLMYALLDVADRVGWARDRGNPLSEVRDIEERPFVPERALSKYTMHRATFESFFHDEAYWERYLDMLARNRFNTFALLLGYEAHGFMAPPYPYFFDVPGFPDVRLAGLSKEAQKRNLDSLNDLIRMVHDRGMDFTLGIWDHIYRGGVQGGRLDSTKPTPGLVWGVSKDNLVPYTTAALRKLVKVVPGIDAIQFRMHGESGLKRGEMETFWPEVYRIMRDAGSGIRFDARAKNYPHHLIERGVDMGMDLRMTTKYWAEQMGLPFHPTHIPRQNQRDRRHGYADMLRYPQRYKMHWRMWTGGTTRLFLWGDPEYVRRFAASTLLYDGDGFEVTEPMGTKMQTQPHDRKPFDLLGEAYRYYDWEFERYWHFFQVFGRIGYNPETPPEVWETEFRRRLGAEAGPILQRALHRASWILPMINAPVWRTDSTRKPRVPWPSMMPLRRRRMP